MIVIAIVAKEKWAGGRFVIHTVNMDVAIIGDGQSVSEAKVNFEKALQEASGAGNELEYKYDIASVFNLFDFINVSQFAKRADINAILLRQYKSCNTYISKAQLDKIEHALREAGRELSAISLTPPTTKST